MIFYFCTTHNFGTGMKLSPRIPDSIDPEHEDNETKRICVSSSTEGCLKGIGQNVYNKVYVYKCVVDIKDIYQPTESEVYDVFITGEIWILKDTYFTLYSILNIDTKKTIYYKIDDNLNNYIDIYNFEYTIERI